MADITGSQGQQIAEVLTKPGGATGVAPGTGLGTTPVELEVGATVAAAANNQTLVAAAGKRTYITGFRLDGLGATAGSIITVTVTGLAVTLTYLFSVPAGAAVATTPLAINFPRPIPASADNTAIVVNVASYGVGNTQAIAMAYGFQL